MLDSDGGARPAVVVGLIDLDRFKEVNNALGHEVEDCPFTGYLDSRGGRQDDVQRWHAQQHRADSSSGASRMIVDWLVREIRSGA